MKNLVIPDFKEGSDKKTLGQILNIPRSSIPEYLSNARYGADAALGPGNNGMNAKDKVSALKELPFWWREATIEEVINVVQKKKAG